MQETSDKKYKYKQYTIKILYEDNHLLLALKPPGLLSQADKGGSEDILTILKGYLKVEYKKPGRVYLGLVHRLDRPVGGIMVFAKTSKAASRMSALIRERQMERSYLALVEGRMEKKLGRLDNYLFKGKNNQVREDFDRGKKSVLSYKEIFYDEESNLSALDISLHTGRSHQIRAQFSLAGHPLAGDRRYGSGKVEIEKNFDAPALFAYKLAFLHPVKKERMFFVEKPNRAFAGNFKYFDKIITYIDAEEVNEDKKLKS